MPCRSKHPRRLATGAARIRLTRATLLVLALSGLAALAVPASTRAQAQAGTESAVTATPTTIDVRVIAKGANFIGTSMGGVSVTIEDADTGELLAHGTARGSTGDTGRIMKESHVRPRVLSTEGASKFSATLDLAAPRRIRVTALGPLAQRQAANEVSATQWVVPGKDLTGGDGLLLEMPGFAVDVLSPPSHSRLGEATVRLAANVTMMCGCPIEPGGLWDADGLEVAAIVYRNGERVATVPLAYAGSTSQFAIDWTAPESGTYEAVVYAYDPSNGNTGLDRTTFIVQ
jgi:hypothetical protein